MKNVIKLIMQENQVPKIRDFCWPILLLKVDSIFISTPKNNIISPQFSLASLPIFLLLLSQHTFSSKTITNFLVENFWAKLGFVWAS